MKCIHCPKELRPEQLGVHREIKHGWTENRDGGGANKVELPVYTGRLMCSGCMEAAKRGLIGQETLA